MRFVRSLFVLLILAYGAQASPQCPQLTIMPLSLPGGATGRAYSQDVNVLGGSGRYSFAIIANALPPGLGLNVSSGVISGTPTTTGSFSFLLRVTDSNGCTGTRAYTIEVVCGPAGIGPSSLPAAQIGVVYSQNFSASNGKSPYSYSIVSGALPNGLTLDSNGGLSGTPLAGTTGTWTFDVAVVDGNPCGTAKGYSLVVTCPVITVLLSTVSAGTTGVPFSQTLSASGGTGPYSFGTQASALPPGLTLSTTGVLSGTPTAPGTYSFIVRATDANGCFGERSYSQVINQNCPVITVNPASLAVGQVGLAYSLVFSASGGTSPYTFRISTGALPPGMSFINGSVSGSPTTAGSYAFSIQATDANGCKGERAYTLVVNTPTCPAITIPNILPVPRVGNSYSQTISATGGTGPYSFSILSGVLPPGLTLSSNGNLTGTPSLIGTFTFTIKATDSNGCSGERTYTQNVLPCEGVTISPLGTGVPSGRVGVPYALAFTGSGGTAPYVFSLGNFVFLPPGMSLSTSGVLSGTPTTAGGYTFLVVVTSANGCFGQALIFLNIDDSACPDIAISPSVLTSMVVDVDYSQDFTASGGTGPYAWDVSAGTLPPGLLLKTNVLTGRPTTAGTYGFVLRATDRTGCAGVRNYVLNVNSQACPVITINPTATTLPAANATVTYSQPFSATGGTAPYSFSLVLGALPSGLSLAANGNLTGIPAAAGSYSFTVRATDVNGCSNQRTYSLTVNSFTCPNIVLNPSALPAGVIGSSYNQTINANGGTGPYSFVIGSGTLPAGLSLAANGSLTGSPTVSGTFNFAVKATDANGCTGERSYSLVINSSACPSISMSPTALPPGTNGTTYSQTIAASGGNGPYTFSISGGTLPIGLSLASNGNLTGMPGAAGNFTFSIRATDSNSCTGDRSYAITIAPSVLTSVSAASFAPSGPLAPESIVAAFGASLTHNTEAASTQPLPTKLADMTLMVRDSAGIERLAPLYFASASQVNYQLPPGTSLGRATLTLLNEDALANTSVVAAGILDVAQVAPGLFSADSRGSGLAAAQVFRVKSSGAQSYEAVARYDSSQSKFVAEPIDFGPVTDQIFLVLYGTGFKFKSSLSSVTCTVAGMNSEVLYAGEVLGYTGLEQINIRLSRSLAGRGEVDVIITVDGKPANTVRIAFR